MNVLNVPISFFSQLTGSTTPDNSKTLMQILQCPFLHKKFMPRIEAIRAEPDKAERNKLKSKLPVFTPSGIFSQRSAAGLIRHSGLLSFDIDSADNKFLNSTTAPKVRDEIAKLAEVAYIGLSASGAGVWGIIAISNPDDHAGHFRALQHDFKKYGFTIDTSCKDVSRARYWSIDTDARFNVLAETYTRTQSEPQNHQTRPHATRHTHQTHDAHTEAARVECIIQQIEGRRYDLTGTYTEWFSLGCSIACEFGENGRDMYHRISQYHAEYNPTQTDTQYNRCLSQARHTRTPIGVFFKAAGRAGFMFKGHATPPAQQREQPHEAPARMNDVYFEGIGLGGNQFRVLLNEYGYPASWDEPIPRAANDAQAKLLPRK